jgi:U4/U6.U5 tri-snRNP-associated protein 2
LPPPPLFQDALEKNIIPQVNIHTVLAKYDGRTTQENAGQLRRYKCQRLPRYIILHCKRFTKNVFVEEKNPTIVNFPLRGVDFRDYVDNPPPDISTLYDLIANVTHESVAGTTRDKENTAWKVYLRAAGGGGESERWYMIQDLIVEETRKEMIFLGEAVLQVRIVPKCKATSQLALSIRRSGSEEINQMGKTTKARRQMANGEQTNSMFQLRSLFLCLVSIHGKPVF